MRIRWSAIAGVAVVLAVAGCTEQPDKVSQPTARVTVNGAARTTHAVRCAQLEWLLTIDITAGPSQVSAVLRLGADKPTVTRAEIANFDGFSGFAGVGDAGLDATFAHDTYTITGTAHGPNPDDPSNPRTGTFKIEAECQ